MSQPLKILIVDDDKDDFIITSEYIRHIPDANYQLDWCAKYNDALEHMLRKNYQLYFVDYRLGAKSGVDLLKEAISNDCDDPIILLTGKGNYEVDIKAMQLGAIDYLVKTELTAEKMERSIRYAMERSASMKALRANERKYRSIFEKSKDIIFTADKELRFIDVNNAIEVVLGYTVNEMKEKSLLDIIKQAQHKKYLQQTIAIGKEVNEWEVILNTKSGEKKSVTLTATHEFDHEERGYIQGIIHDITNLKKAEKVTLQAEKLAAAGRLVRTLAHEVRNPLNNITLSVEQMQQDDRDETSMMYLEIIQRNGKRINDLISELLYTSRPAEMTFERQLLQAVIDDVITSALDRITLKHIKLFVSYPDEPLYVDADKEKLVMALLNIVINAIEAMEEYNGQLSVSLQKLSEFITLKISDNGCGISEENISRLFEPYFTQKRNGMGLGLASTLNILQTHKASVDVSSTLGEGTTFTVSFPLTGVFHEPAQEYKRSSV